MSDVPKTNNQLLGAMAGVSNTTLMTNNQLLKLILANMTTDNVHFDKVTLENGTTILSGLPFKPRLIDMDLSDMTTNQSTYIAKGRAIVDAEGNINQYGWGNFRSDASNNSGNTSSLAHIVATAYYNGSSTSSNCRSQITAITQDEDETWSITFNSTNMTRSNVKQWVLTIYR